MVTLRNFRREPLCPRPRVAERGGRILRPLTQNVWAPKPGRVPLLGLQLMPKLCSVDSMPTCPFAYTKKGTGCLGLDSRSTILAEFCYKRIAWNTTFCYIFCDFYKLISPDDFLCNIVFAILTNFNSLLQNIWR